MEKNIILYGPPGTGKTYCTHLYAVSVIENRPLEALEKEEPGELRRRFQGYRQQGLIEFTTFHQSFSYEDFVEGIRPDVQENEGETGGNISYHVEAGGFKQFCDRAAGERFAESLKAETAALGEKLGVSGNSVIWKVSLAGTGNNPVRQECLDHGHIRIGWDLYGKDITEETVFTKGGKTVLNAFLHKMQPGDIVVSCYSEDLTDAVGVVIGEYEWHDEYSEYKRVRKVRWLVKNIRQSVVELNGGMKMTLSTVYQMKNVNLDELLDIVKQHRPAREERPVPASQGTDRRVFIIDEINRGNIAGIFGELITLIEPSKRLGAAEALKVRLPYSRQEFGVPDNVYVIGTMNTADRSLTGLDIALRRRFSFVHMPPKPELLAGKELCDSGVAVSDVLAVMNRRISVLLDQDHCLGHAPFLSLSEGKVRVDELARVFS